MPQDNLFYANDKQDIVNNLIRNNFRPQSLLFSDVIADLQSLVTRLDIQPEDNLSSPAVDSYRVGSGGGEPDYFRVYTDGKIEPIDHQTFTSERGYNLLPKRYRTYNPQRTT